MQLCFLVGMTLMAFPAARAHVEAALPVIASLPECAKSCLLSIVASSPCTASNMTCMCGNEKLHSDMTGCVTKACSVKEALNTKNITSTSCDAPIRDKGRNYVNISNAFGIISAIFVVQRFAYKIWAELGVGLDDWLTLATLISGVPSTVMNAVALTQNGMGRDIWTVTPSQITNFSKIFFVMEILYFFQVAALKLALLFFYIRIFAVAPVQRLLWGTIAFTAMYGLVFIFVGSFQCNPVRHFWMKWDGEQYGSCLNVNALAWSNAAISIALDCWMLAIPLWQLKSLDLNLKRKIGVGIMFCVGTFITVVSILRLRSLVKFGTDIRNPTWDFFDVGLWSTVEINVGIICTCMPTMRLFLVRLFPFPQRLGTTHRYHTKSSTNKASPNSRKSRLTNLGRASKTAGEQSPALRVGDGIQPLPEAV